VSGVAGLVDPLTGGAASFRLPTDARWTGAGDGAHSSVMSPAPEFTGEHPGDRLPPRPRAGERRFVAAVLAVYWVGLQTTYFAFQMVRGGPPPGGTAPSPLVRYLTYMTTPSELAICLGGAVICYAIYEVLRRTSALRLPAKLLASLALTILGAIAFSAVVMVISLVAGMALDPFWRNFVLNAFVWFSPMGLWTAAALAITYNAEIVAREQRLAALREQAQAAQIRALHFQLNPHFLYNTLNAISALILDGRGADADRMVLGLSAFLRETLHRDPLGNIALADEIALQRLYLDIEATRFEDGLDIAIALPEALVDARVPSLILQPLVENALRHGVPEPPERMRLSVHAAEADAGRTLVLEVSDNGPGSRADGGGGGIGLRNVRDRIAVQWGEDARLDTSSDAGGFTARVSMPLVRA